MHFKCHGLKAEWRQWQTETNCFFKNTSASLNMKYVESGNIATKKICITEWTTEWNPIPIITETDHIINLCSHIDNCIYFPVCECVCVFPLLQIFVSNWLLDNLFSLINAGNQAGDRRKWIHLFENVNTVFFFSSFTDFSQQSFIPNVKVFLWRFCVSFFQWYWFKRVAGFSANQVSNNYQFHAFL